MKRFFASVVDLQIPRKFWRRFFRRYLWILLGLALIIFGIKSGGVWIHDKWTNRQSRHLAAEAELRIREGRTTEARMALETALRLNPKNITALRSLAALQTSLGQFPEAMKTWQKIVDAGALTFADIPPYALLAAKTQDWEITQRLLDATKALSSPSMPHLLQAELSLIRGNLEDAERSLRMAHDVDDKREPRAALARFLLVHKNTPEHSAEILSLLRKLSLEKDEIGALALASALEHNLVPQNEIPSWIAALKHHPKSSPAMLLVADSARTRLDPSTRPLVAASVYARLGNESLEARTAGFHWLLQSKEPALAARLVTREEALSRPDLFVKWLDALSASGRREEILKVLDDPANPLPKVQTRLYQANTLKLLGKWKESHDFYRRVLEWSFDRPQARIKVMTYVYLAGENQLFEWSLRPLLKSPGPARIAMRDFLPVAQSLRDIQQTRRLHELALEEGGLPQVHHLRNELDYSDLILGKEVDPERISLLATLNPDDLPLRLTWALSLLRDRDGVRAAAELQDCERIPNSDPVLEARLAMLKAAALAANGQRTAALKVRGNPKLGILTHQENAFLRQALLFPLISMATEGIPTPAGVGAGME